MKLVLFIILLCGITTTPVRTVNIAKTKKTLVGNAKAAAARATTATLDMVPSGLIFQF
jgi:hypothetical protein